MTSCNSFHVAKRTWCDGYGADLVYAPYICVCEMTETTLLSLNQNLLFYHMEVKTEVINKCVSDKCYVNDECGVAGNLSKSSGFQ